MGLDTTGELDEKSLIPTGLYQHYKGQQYLVFGTARHSETEEVMVIYRTCYGNFDFWVRPLEMFQETVRLDGREVPRFRLME